MKRQLRNISDGSGLLRYQMMVISLMGLAAWIASLMMG